MTGWAAIGRCTPSMGLKLGQSIELGVIRLPLDGLPVRFVFRKLFIEESIPFHCQLKVHPRADDGDPKRLLLGS